MQDIYHIDSSFNEELSKQNILSIRLSTDGFSFCIHDGKGKLLILFTKSFHGDSNNEFLVFINDIFSSESILRATYKNVYVLTDFRQKALIPFELFDNSNIYNNYVLYQQDLESKFIYNNTITELKINVIADIQRDLKIVLDSYHSQIKLVSATYLFLSDFYQTNLQDYNLIIKLSKEYFDLVIFENSNLIFFNTFSYNADEDILYYLTNCIRLNNVDTEKMQMYISGKNYNISGLESLLFKYYPRLTHLETSNIKILSKGDKIDFSYYDNLLNVHKCEL